MSNTDAASLGEQIKLTDEEWQVMRGHPERGYRLLLESGTARGKIVLTGF